MPKQPTTSAATPAPAADAELAGADWLIRTLALDTIDQGPQLIRSEASDDEIAELASDIAAHGLMQPIGVRATPLGRYQLLWGGRRLAAFRRLRRSLIPARVLPDDHEPIKATAARENLLRRQLSLGEEIDAVHSLHFDDRRSPDEIASLVSKSRSWVLRRLAVRSLPGDLREPLLDGTIPIGHAEALALLEDPGMRAYATQTSTAGRYTLSQVRQLVEALQASAPAPGATENAPTPDGSPLAAQPLLIACAACDAPRPVAALVLIRVCAGGCTPPQPEKDSTNGDATDSTDG